jgi:hypothetical protein
MENVRGPVSGTREEHDPGQRHSSAAGRTLPQRTICTAGLPQAGISSSQAEPELCLSVLTGEALTQGFELFSEGRWQAS